MPFCNHPSFLIIMQCARHILHFFFLFFSLFLEPGTNQESKSIVWPTTHFLTQTAPDLFLLFALPDLGCCSRLVSNWSIYHFSTLHIRKGAYPRTNPTSCPPSTAPLRPGISPAPISPSAPAQRLPRRQATDPPVAGKLVGLPLSPVRGPRSPTLPLQSGSTPSPCATYLTNCRPSCYFYCWSQQRQRPRGGAQHCGKCVRWGWSGSQRPATMRGCESGRAMACC